MRASIALCVVTLACHHAQPEAPARPCHPPPAVVRTPVVTMSADTSVIEGSVYDSWSLQLLSSAAVLYWGTRLGTYTDTMGRFRLPRLPTSAHDTTVVLRVLRVGHDQQRDTLVLTPGHGVNVIVYLRAAQFCLEPIGIAI